MHDRPHHVLLVVAAAAAVLAAGCGTGSDAAAGPGAGSPAGPSGASSSGGGTGPSSPAGPTKLTVASTEASGTAVTWTLSCDPVGGDHPDAAAACARLSAAQASVFEPVPVDVACTMVYGGPQTASVTGTWRGTAVDASFKRTDGCEIARWEALLPLLPAPG